MATPKRTPVTRVRRAPAKSPVRKAAKGTRSRSEPRRKRASARLPTPQEPQRPERQLAARRGPLLMLLLGALPGLLILLAPFAPFVQPKPTRVWRGYSTLLVRAGGPADARLKAEAARLGPGVVSAYTTPVDFYDFSSSARVRYADLARRLDALDPRRDPYINGMAGYFSTTSGDADFHVAFIPARRGALATFVTLARRLGGLAGWRLLEFDPAEKLLSIAAPLCASLLMSLARRRRRRGVQGLAVAGALLWAPALLASGPDVLALCLVLLCFWLPVLEARCALYGPGRSDAGVVRKPLALYLVVGAVSLAAFFLLNGFSLPTLLQPLAPFLVSLLLLLLVPQALEAARGRRQSRVFAAVPLLRPSRGRQRVLSVALFSLVLVVLVPLLRGGAFPAPRPVSGSGGFSWEDIARLHKGPRVDRLPDLSDYVAHEAYQQTLAFGRTWKYPDQDERVYRHDYLVDPASGTVRARLRTVKVLDAAWLADILARPVPGSLEALLLAQGRPAVVTAQGPGRALAGELPFITLAFLALLGLLLKSMGKGLLIRGNLWRLNSEARRDQIP